MASPAATETNSFAASGLPDQYVVLLEKVLKSNQQMASDNKALRELIQKRNDSLKELEESFRRESETPKARRRSRKQVARMEVSISPICRRETRKVYQNLIKKDDFQGFEFAETFGSQHNSAIVVRVKEEVLHKNGGENCKWTHASIEAALKRYFISLSEKAKQIERRSYETHKRKCRRQGRQREKLNHRVAALELVKWSDQKKLKAAAALQEEAMSSEESCFEEDEEGVQKLVAYEIKRLPWESNKLKKYKYKLDRAHVRALSARSRERVITRRDAALPSTRAAPESLPEWAVRM